MEYPDAYDVLAEKHNQSKSVRYRKILELLMTQIQAQIAVLLPATPEDLSTKLNIDLSRVRNEIHDLFVKGVIIPKDFKTMEGARFCRTVLQLHDASEANARLDPTIEPELLDAWEDFCQKEWYPQRAEEFAKRDIPRDRVIPAYKSVKDIPGLTRYDDVREILRAAPLIAVVPCSCRRQVRHSKTIVESCLQFGRSAEYAIARGSGRQVSYDEAIKVVDRAEEDGQVHTWPNERTLSYGVMCNCTRDACVAWTPIIQQGLSPLKRAAKSRFQATVNQDVCSGCQQCIDRCQFDAIDMVKFLGAKKLKAAVQADKCAGCGVCVIACEPRALSMELVRALEHIPEHRPVLAQ